MSRSSQDYETPTNRIALLGIAFAVLVAIGFFTVLRPELEQEPEQEPAQSAQAASSAGETRAVSASPAP